MSKIIVDIENLSKSYVISKNEKFNSIENFSLQINQGEKWGIIGKNGSGKSTLLSILSGIIKPSSGTIKLYGTLSYILDIGSNFIPELTGKENVLMFLALNGFSKIESYKLLKKVEEFAEIGLFIDQPIKTYSNGMFLRLAFSASIQINADILLIDEVFSAGDASFREKLKDYFSSKFQSSNQTVLLVSHNPDEIMDFCTHCIWLEKGKIIQKGSVKDVIAAYYKNLMQENLSKKMEHNNTSRNIIKSQIENGFENETFKLLFFSIKSVYANEKLSYETGLAFNISVFKKIINVSIHPQIVIYDYQHRPILTLFPQIGSDADKICFENKNTIGELNYNVELPPFLLTYGLFYAELRFGKNLDINKDDNQEAGKIHEKLYFEIAKSSINEYIGRTENVFIRPKSNWAISAKPST